MQTKIQQLYFKFSNQSQLPLHPCVVSLCISPGCSILQYPGSSSAAFSGPAALHQQVFHSQVRSGNDLEIIAGQLCLQICAHAGYQQPWNNLHSKQEATNGAVTAEFSEELSSDDGVSLASSDSCLLVLFLTKTFSSLLIFLLILQSGGYQSSSSTHLSSNAELKVKTCRVNVVLTCHRSLFFERYVYG